ncbi:MAG: hypothetical protein IPK66_03000 [Rhodospirillales bacterium]|nr:hypothetical protein [Rhodospirillales bacterium]
MSSSLCLISVAANENSAPSRQASSRPLEDFIWINTNFKYGFDNPNYVESLNTNLPKGFLSGVREAPQVGVPTSSAAVPKPTYPWDGRLSWFSTIRDPTLNSWIQGRKLLINPGVSAVYEGPAGQQYSETTWGDNIRWRLHQMALPFPTADDAVGWLHPNECDNADMTFGDFVRDAPANEAQVAMDRLILLAKMMWQELRTGPFSYRTEPHPGFILGPTISRAAIAALTAANGDDKFSIYDILTRNNGEILDFYDGIDIHNHMVSRILEFNNKEPGLKEYNLFQGWKSLQEANRLRVLAGKQERLLPITSTESGVSDTPPNGVYVKDYINHSALRGYTRMHVMFCAMHWWAISLWTIFSFGRTGGDVAPYDFTEGVDGVPKADWPVLLDIVDYRKYSIDRYTSEILQKTWEDFNKPYTWCVHVLQNVEPEAGITEGNPWPTTNWARVTFPGGRIDMTSGGRNLVYRPVHLTSLGPHKISVEVQTTGIAKLRARGYDKLNGLAEQAEQSTSASWTTIEVIFTPRQHSVTHLPNPCYVLICLDHNGVGTASFRNPQITAL